MLADVLARKSSENTMGTQWRVCLCHNTPSLTVFPIISFRHKPWAQSWISSIGSGLVCHACIPRVSGCLSSLPVPPSPARCRIPSFSANTCTARSKRTSLHVSSSPESPRSYNAFFLRGQIVLRPCLLVMNQRTLMQAEDVVLQGGKGNQARILNCPLAFG